MKVLLSWLKEFVDVEASGEEIGARLSLRGFALEGIERLPDGDQVLDFDVTSNRPDCMLVMVEKNSAFELDVLALADKTLTAFGDVRGTQPTEAVFSPDGRWVLYQTTSDDRRQALSSRSRGRAPSIWFRWKFLAIHSGSRKIIA